MNQKPAMIKGLPLVKPSRAFTLWLTLLLLYVLLLPSAVQTPNRDAKFSTIGEQSVGIVPHYRLETLAERR